MRFVRIRVARFGPLTGLDTGERDLPGLVAVHGVNEAGKSSFHVALRALLHGFYPATREGNRWSPWDGGEAELEAVVQVGDEERARVHRRLLSTPWGRLERNGEAEDIRNESLPWVSHVSRAIYEQVFSVTLPELARLRDGSTWETIRDRLVTGMGTLDLVAPRQVADALEEEAMRLWRPDRRGMSRDRALEQERGELGARLASARERDRSLRADARRLEEVEHELAGVLRRRARLREHLHMVRTYLPARQRLQVLRELRDEAGDPTLLENLPRDPVGRLEELDKEAERARSARDEALQRVEELRVGVPPPDPVDAALVEHVDAARALAGRGALAAEQAERLPAARVILRRLDGELDRLGRELFGEPAEPVQASSVQALPLSDLRRHLEDWRERSTRLAQAEEAVAAARARPLPPEPETRLPGRVILAAIVAIAGLAGGSAMFVLGDRLLAPGAVLAMAGIVAGAAAWVLRAGWRSENERRARERGDREAEIDALERRRQSFDDERAEVSARIDRFLEGLPVRAERLAPPGPDLPSDLERLRDLLGERERAAAEVHALEEANDRIARELSGLRENVPGLSLPREAVRALSALEERLRTAEALERERAEAGRALDTAHIAAERAEEELDRRETALRELIERLAPVGSGLPPASAARRAGRRLDALREAQQIDHELRAAFGDEEALAARIESAVLELEEEAGRTEGGDLDAPSMEARLEAEDEALERRLVDLHAERADLGAALRPVTDEETADVLEGELERIEEERSAVRRERDRLWLLARVVRVAEHRFREANQPELVRRAEGYLSDITGGRYGRLLLGDETNPDALRLRASHLPDALAVDDPISTGTREQVYLALRMAIVDLVEGPGERLPLLLDEALVNWDAGRLERGLDLLASMAETRQVFLFTCHRGVADAVARHGGHVVELAAPEGLANGS